MVQITVSTEPVEAAPAPRVAEHIRQRLRSVDPWEWRSWVAAGAVALIAAILRVVNLGHPSEIIFDEEYYAVEARELLEHGVEWRTVTGPDGQVITEYGDRVVHPPLGKWLIAAGIRLAALAGVGNDAFGWRIMGVIVGVLMVLIVTRTARRMFGSTVLGCAAGLLMALDGFHFVLSRTAILDIYLAFFVLAAFACLVLDRDARRRRWLRALEDGLDPSAPGREGRPRLGWDGVPWWRLAAGALLGLGCAVKWSAIFFLPVFLVLVYLWEVGVRRTVGVRHPWRDALLDEIGWTAAAGALVVAAYLAGWTGWFLTDTGWKRHYLQAELGQRELPVIGALQNLWHYHREMLSFHTQVTSDHPYQSWPWQWLLLARPVAFYYRGDGVCGGEQCAAEVLLLGTPVLWWAFLPALGGLVWFGISRRDWRALAIGAGAFAGIAPWFYYQTLDRTMFYFYAAPAEPFLILAVAYVLGALITGPGVGRLAYGRVRAAFTLPAEARRRYGVIVAAAFVMLVAICFWWYYPLYVGEPIPYSDWARRMLLGDRWI